MNIYGIGTDIVNVNRIKNAIRKNNKLFTKKIYTTFEIKTCEKRIKELKSNFLNKYIYSIISILILLLVAIFYFVSR